MPNSRALFEMPTGTQRILEDTIYAHIIRMLFRFRCALFNNFHHNSYLPVLWCVPRVTRKLPRVSCPGKPNP